MSNIKTKVDWFSERCDEKDDNNGEHYGIYVFDCDEEDYDEEAGYGVYNICDVFWFKSESKRDKKYDKLN